ncbi:MAG: hypothetical protein WC699_11740 [Bacteroidales bacterium]|jgi:hypothetical protein
MKIKLFYLFISLAVVSTGCKKEPVILPDVLVTAKTQLTARFLILDQKMAEAASYMASVNLDTTLVRAKLLELVNEFPDIIEFAQITPAGIMKIIEPSAYHGTQGADISNQEHVIRAYASRQPVLSQVFLAVEGFNAAVVMHPVLINGVIAGGITALFYPETILGLIMRPLNEGLTFELWAMEKGGRLIYDAVASEIGHNLITGEEYKEFPELVAAAGKIDAEDSGTVTYSYYQAGTTVSVKKLTYWTTYEFHGTQWKLVWGQPE